MTKRTKNIVNLLLPISFLLFTSTAHSLESVDFVIEASVQSGGEDIVTVFNSDNSNNSKTISAGSGLELLLGANFNLSTSSYIKLVTGFVSDTAEGTSFGAPFKFEWKHTPVDLLYMKQSGSWNFGGGITYHINPKFTSSGAAAGNDIGFDNALGLKLAFDYRFSTNIFLGLKYTVIDYKVNTKNTVKDSADGNSIGLVLGYVFAD